MSVLLKLTLKAESCAVHPNRSCTEQLWTCEHDSTYPATIKSVLSTLMLIVGRATTTTLHMLLQRTVQQTSGSSGTRTNCRYLCKTDGHGVAYACSGCVVSILYRGSVLRGNDRASNLAFDAITDGFD